MNQKIEANINWDKEYEQYVETLKQLGVHVLYNAYITRDEEFTLLRIETDDLIDFGTAKVFVVNYLKHSEYPVVANVMKTAFTISIAIYIPEQKLLIEHRHDIEQ